MADHSSRRAFLKTGAGLLGGGVGWWLTDHVHDADDIHDADDVHVGFGFRAGQHVYVVRLVVVRTGVRLVEFGELS